ncbi:MAG: hypothetical protein NVS9B10_28700 [Nevskia sp.]
MKPRDPLKPAAAAIATMLLASPAYAAEGLYVGLQGGVGLPSATRISTTANGTTTSSDAKFKDGPLGGLVLGYGFANGLQPELEASYQRNEPKGRGGDIRAGTATGNLYYNFSQHGYYFYVGGGGGATYVRLHASGGGGDSSYKPVYQAGTGFGLTAARNLLVGIDYRYRGSFERAKFSYVSQGVATETRFNYRGSAVTIGLRWAFGEVAATGSAPGYREPVSIVPLQPN